MNKFYRIGEKISNISILGANISNFSIVIHSDGGVKAPPVVMDSISKSAVILQNYIFKITDIKIPVLMDKNPIKTKREIFIGGTEREEDILRDYKFSDEEYRIKTSDKNLSINGGKRGILYGVYTFIEDYFGVRFFTKDCERILFNPEIKINEIDCHYNPVFEYREYCHWLCFDPEFSVKLKINGNFVRKLRSEDGYGVGFAGGFSGLVHTFSHLVSPDEYFESNPEYFAMDESGKSKPGGICFHNEQTLKIALNTAKKWLAEEKNPTLISVSVNDGEMEYCRCPKCKKILSEGGNDTDNLIYFVNKFSREIHKDYPDVKVETISYANVSEPPKIIKPDSDIVIRLCAGRDNKYSIPGAIKQYKKNEDEELKSAVKVDERIKQWGNFAEKIYVWDYPYPYHVINSPFPIISTMLENMRYFADHKVKGIYINGNTECCEFDELKIYLLSKAIFNPYMTKSEFNRHFDEFLCGYYGKGWRYIKKYILLTEKLTGYFSNYSFPEDIIPIKFNSDGRLDYSFINEANTLFSEAIKKASSPGEKRRIEKSWLHVLYYEVFTTMDYIMENGTNEEKNEIINKNKKLYEKLVEYGIVRVMENTLLPIVKNFEQHPREYFYWDFECVTADRNNENYERDLYVLVPFDKPLGTRVDFSCIYRTNNENDRGFIGAVGLNGKIINSEFNPSFYNCRDKVINIYEGVVTNVKEFSKNSGIDENDVRLNLIPKFTNGIILRIYRMDAGAYLTLKNVKILNLI